MPVQLPSAIGTGTDVVELSVGSTRMPSPSPPIHTASGPAAIAMAPFAPGMSMTASGTRTVAAGVLGVAAADRDGATLGPVAADATGELVLGDPAGFGADE